MILGDLSMTNSQQEESLLATISNVALLMLIAAIDQAAGHRNNPDSNADDLECYANDSWRDRMQ